MRQQWRSGSRQVGMRENGEMAFDLEEWKSRLGDSLGRFSADPKGAMKRAGALTLFGYLAGMTLFPLVEAARQGEFIPVVATLGSIAGTIGANLVANKVQRWRDEATAIQELEKELPDSPELRRAMDQILTKLGVMEGAQREMQEEDRRWLASQLGREVQLYQKDLPRICATLTGLIDSLVVFSERDTYVTYVTYVTNIVNQVVSTEAPEADPRQATERYLQYFVDRYQYLEMKGMGISDRAIRLPLLGMYIPLEARTEVPEGETWLEELRLAGRNLRREGEEDLGRGLSELRSLLELLRRSDGLIVLGDPGAGKTTFLKYLALKLARGEGEELGLGPRLPVLVPLSAYANALAERDVPLDQFIADYFCERVADLPIDKMLEATLEGGDALVLLDGLDEVREPRLRHTVVQRVVDFYSYHRRAGNKFALTSRLVGYREERPIAEGLVECTLVDFGDEEIEAFTDNWTAAVERAATGETEFAAEQSQRERGELLEAIECTPGVRGLAANPLLLTILALMKRQGVRLPDRRVQLYDKYVETLLSSWNLARGLGRPPMRDLDVVQTVRILAQLALWMHEQSPGVGLVKEEELKRKLVVIYGYQGEEDPARAARQFLDDVHDYAGLLLERGAAQYGFVHLTFEEYLAAVGLARVGQGKVEPIVDTLAKHVGDPAWREVALLTIGYLGIVQQREEVASGVVSELLKRQPGERGEVAVLMGDAVVDAWPGGVTTGCRNEVVDVLLRTMTDDGVRAPLRASAGRALARLGDPRPQVMSIEGMEFCYVPPGQFWMGSQDDPTLWDSETPVRQVQVAYGYWVGRHAVTNAQFGAFLNDPRGYVSDRWWTPEGLESRKQRIALEDYGAPWNLPNHPVVGVNWYEAIAFAHWVDRTVKEAGFAPESCIVRLPSETEWEKAARGGLEIPSATRIARLGPELPSEPACTVVENPAPLRRFPWGDEPDANRANYHDADIGSTTAVGCFGGGASVYGVEDLSGNAYEWCGTKWEPNYQSYKGDEQPEGAEGRVVRGGAFWDMQTYTRCSRRQYLDPHIRTPYLGLRLIVVPRHQPAGVC